MDIASDPAPLSPPADPAVDVVPVDPLVTPTAEALAPAGATLAQFFRFGCVGALGFVWDAGTVYLLRPVVGLMTATFVAYFVAASLNWLANRLWTFRHVASDAGLLRQWLHFLGANTVGFLLNRSAVYTLFLTVPLCVAYPPLALAVGALTGMFANFSLSRRLVFRVKRPSANGRD
ncbi:hypothetical protein AA103196_1696 [Ameyamaea chiangmaiensis NBRC 103196]|uniref:GtrA family protein n=1 Tax=Ameyamaea chiangmaiensis TaxID=442969 RepID=A0A850PAQ4_9PROT|nr:GtrA family protein [Ameyamaea chiangmaiensis]MBS4074038.1 GtrA family protein [Ameyamaea chiangmaiensis]NVN39406.1 GtrA family protein [Ameyamaea chiangmaiensis]GBQ67484.1 hypothetical protein AA103196_1696 [Ameyamaea chiangmaiensis NBRC 103196]